MDQALKEQVLAVSELANHKGWNFIKEFMVKSTHMTSNKAKYSDTSGDESLRSWGELRGYDKVLKFVDAMTEERKNIKQP